MCYINKLALSCWQQSVCKRHRPSVAHRCFSPFMAGVPNLIPPQPAQRSSNTPSSTPPSVSGMLTYRIHSKLMLFLTIYILDIYYIIYDIIYILYTKKIFIFFTLNTVILESVVIDSMVWFFYKFVFYYLRPVLHTCSQHAVLK